MSTTTTGPLPRPMLRVVRSQPRGSAKADAMLARAEFRLARRRRLMILAPALLVCLSTIYGLTTRQHPQGFGATAMNIIPALAWVCALVMFPLSAAVKPKPVRAGALIALIFGPALMPLVFGPGGWRLPEIAIAIASVAGAFAPTRVRITLPRR